MRNGKWRIALCPTLVTARVVNVDVIINGHYHGGENSAGEARETQLRSVSRGVGGVQRAEKNSIEHRAKGGEGRSKDSLNQ